MYIYLSCTGSTRTVTMETNKWFFFFLPYVRYSIEPLFLQTRQLRLARKVAQWHNPENCKYDANAPKREVMASSRTCGACHNVPNYNTEQEGGSIFFMNLQVVWCSPKYNKGKFKFFFILIQKVTSFSKNSRVKNIKNVFVFKFIV